MSEHPHPSDLRAVLVRNLGLSSRTVNCLEYQQILTLQDLVCCTFSQLRAVRSLGRLSIKEIEDKLKSMRLSLGTPSPDCHPPVSLPEPAHLRDHFAGLAMQGLVGAFERMGNDDLLDTVDHCAQNAYHWADAMLIARKGKP